MSLAAWCSRRSVSIMALVVNRSSPRASAEFDQIGRIAHRAHDFVELLDAMAVPVREDSDIAG